MLRGPEFSWPIHGIHSVARSSVLMMVHMDGVCSGILSPIGRI